MMKEKIMQKELQKVFTQYSKYCVFQPIESRTRVGIPDIYYCIPENFAGWIELKVAKKTKNGVNIPYRPGQRIWLLEHKSINSRTFVLIWCTGIYYLINRSFCNCYKNIEKLKLAACWSNEKIDVTIIPYLKNAFLECYPNS